MNRQRHDSMPPAPRQAPVATKLNGVVLATLAALLVCAMVAISPTAPPDTRTSVVEELVTMADDLAVRSIEDACPGTPDAMAC